MVEGKKGRSEWAPRGRGERKEGKGREGKGGIGELDSKKERVQYRYVYVRV